MKNKLLPIWTVIVITVSSTFLASCKKDNTAPAPLPPSTVNTQLSFGVKADNPFSTFSIIAQGNSTYSSTATVNFTSGTANISGFKLEATKRNLQIEIRSKNLANVDLFSTNTALTGATIDTGTYNQIEVRVELSKSSTAALPLVLKGTFTNNSATAMPIELDFNDDAEIKAQAQNVVVSNNASLSTIITMHLNRLLAGVSATQLNSATLTNGTLVISSTSNTSIYAQVKNNLSNCADDGGFDKHDNK
jgi:hypothetical protein